MGYDPLQDLGYFTYAFTAILYSIFVFVDAPSSKANLIFKKQNAKHLPAVISIHIAFLAAILGLTRVAGHFYWSLPNWMTSILFHARQTDISFLGIVFVLVTMGMYFIERKWIFRELDNEDVVKGSETSANLER